MLSRMYRLPKTRILLARIEPVGKTTQHSRKLRTFAICLPLKRNPKISRSALFELKKISHSPTRGVAVLKAMTNLGVDGGQEDAVTTQCVGKAIG